MAERSTVEVVIFDQPLEVIASLFADGWPPFQDLGPQEHSGHSEIRVEFDDALGGDENSRVITFAAALVAAGVEFDVSDGGHYSWDPRVTHYRAGREPIRRATSIMGEPLLDEATFAEIGPDKVVEFFTWPPLQSVTA